MLRLERDWADRTVGDTSDQLVSDEEIAWTNSQVTGSDTATTDLYTVAYRVMLAIASKFSRLANQAIGDMRVYWRNVKLCEAFFFRARQTFSHAFAIGPGGSFNVVVVAVQVGEVAQFSTPRQTPAKVSIAVLGHI